jgi:hypothetical protein
MPMTELDDFDEIDRKPRFFKWIKQAERILIGVALVGVLFKIQHYPGASLLLLLSLTVLSIIYLVRAFLTYQNISGLSKVSYIVSSLGRSILMIGIIFKIQHFLGASLLLLVGLSFTVLGFVGDVFSSNKA